MKKLVLSQTCQGTVLKQLLMSSEAFKKHFACEFIPNFEIKDGKPGLAPPAALAESLESCDVLIYHDIASYDFPTLLQKLPPHAQAIKIPYVTSTLYWPTHDYRNPVWLAPRGSTALIPWPCIKLNELIVSLRDKAKVLDAYLQMDIPASIDITGILKKQMDYLRQSEKDSIFHVADFVQEQFTQTKLFHLINHPALPIFLNVTNTILKHLGLPLLAGFKFDPFINHQMPIHPSVIRYHGLTWCNENATYRIMDKVFSFEEYVSFYYDCYVEKYKFTMFPERFPMKAPSLASIRRLAASFFRRAARPG